MSTLKETSERNQKICANALRQVILNTISISVPVPMHKTRLPLFFAGQKTHLWAAAIYGVRENGNFVTGKDESISY